MFILNQLTMSRHILQPQRTFVAQRCLSYLEEYRQNEEEPLRHRSYSPTQEHSRHPTIPLQSEHSCRAHTSHHERERSHHSHRPILDSSSSSDSHQQWPRKRIKEGSWHHHLVHQYQVEGSPMSKKVLEAKVLKEYLSAKMNLDSYNGLTDPREHIQNMKGSLELVTW